MHVLIVEHYYIALPFNAPIAKLQRINSPVKLSTIIRGMLAGMAGGLAGTFAMYLFGAGIFALLGLPVNTSHEIIGNSAAAFFAKLGIELPGGVRLGVRFYYLIGLSMGAVFGLAVAWLEPLRRSSLWKKMGLGILYVEVLSVPLLIAGAYALQMKPADAALWFAISVVMHLVYGLVLGAVTSVILSAAKNPDSSLS
jgi:hypothetical protein